MGARATGTHRLEGERVVNSRIPSWTRAPLPPLFPVGTRLRCIDGHDAYVPNIERPRDIKANPALAVEVIQSSGRWRHDGSDLRDVDVDHIANSELTGHGWVVDDDIHAARRRQLG